MMTKEHFNSKRWKIRMRAYEKLGFIEQARNDPYWLIRLKAHEALGWTEQAAIDDDEDIRFIGYSKFGYTKNALYDFIDIQVEAQEYFDECKEVLGEYKLEFTPEEAELLRMNDIKVNKLAIIGK